MRKYTSRIMSILFAAVLVFSTVIPGYADDSASGEVSEQAQTISVESESQNETVNTAATVAETSSDTTTSEITTASETSETFEFSETVETSEASDSSSSSSENPTESDTDTSATTEEASTGTSDTASSDSENSDSTSSSETESDKSGSSETEQDSQSDTASESITGTNDTSSSEATESDVSESTDTTTTSDKSATDESSSEEEETTTSNRKYSVSVPTGEANSVYIAQATSTSCTLASATMLIRNFLYLNGSDDWQNVTESSLRSTAWLAGEGLYGHFSYSNRGNSFYVERESLYSPSIATLKAILDEHPEGIVLYCGNAPHAVLLLDYEGDTFYCADPAGYCSGMRIKLEDSWLSAYYRGQAEILANVTNYWHITYASVAEDENGISWTWNGSTLTISGEGEIAAVEDNEVISAYPWERYATVARTVKIGEGITSIPDYLFSGFTELESITLPSTVTSIGSWTFKDCTSLTDVNLNDGLETIGGRAFWGCTSLETITIPESVIEIGEYAFGNCTALATLVVPGNVSVLSTGLCYGCEVLTDLELNDGLIEIQDKVVYHCSELTEVTIPNTVTTIAEKAFYSDTPISAVFAELD